MLIELDMLTEPADSAATAETAIPEDFALAYDAEKGRAHVLDDSFGRRHTYLRISLVENCNLRCHYCMPEEGLAWTPDAYLLADQEIIRIARLFVGQGITKIRLTGGEPLLRSGVESIAEAIGALDGLKTLALTTNGLLLPKKFDRLQRAGLDQINISLDTLRPERFNAITRRKGLALVMRAIDEAVERGYDPVKVNCVVMRGLNEDELCDFVGWTRDLPLEVRFIEFMPFDGNRWDAGRLYSYAEMLRDIRARYALERLEGSSHDTSKTYRVPGFRGTIGFITSMTENFCEGCNRLRVTADGNLKVCLFGAAEVSLRDAMRRDADDEELLETISRAVSRKHARHAGMYNLAAMQNRPMITIGG